MAALRRSAPSIPASPERPLVLLQSESPYGGRSVTVECDGATTAAYLRSATSAIAATWIANHVPAPGTLATPDAGRAPVMPAAHTKHPHAAPVPDAGSLRALWFEEGDGVVILEHGTPLAALPGWSDMSNGMPGYARDVIGRTPFGWSLDDAMEGLGPRIAAAGEFWRWRGDETAWPGFQQAMLGHLLGKLGPGARYWDVSGGDQPPVGVSERPPTRLRQYTILSTVGMCCQRMPVIEQVGEPAARIELAIATTMPAAEAARIFLWLGQYPWREVTWLGAGHCVSWYHEPATFPLGGGNEAVLLLDNPGGLLGPDVPDLSGFSFGGEPVTWLWVVPVSEPERVLGSGRGPSSLVTHLAAQGRSWVAG